MTLFAVRPRLTIRMLMIVVAICGLALGGWLWLARIWPRHQEAERRALEHARESKQWSRRIVDSKGVAAPVSVTRTPIKGLLRKNLETYGYDTTRPYYYQWHLGYNPDDARKYPIDPLLEETLVVCRERVAYHDRMRRKWARAAWMPWIRFEPDAPKPPIGEPDVSQSY